MLLDTVESTGAAVYAHVRVDGVQDDSGHLDQLLADDGDAPRSRARDGASRIVARLDAATGAKPGRRMTLGIDPEHLYVFDAATGDAIVGANRDAAEAVSAIPGGDAAGAITLGLRLPGHRERGCGQRDGDACSHHGDAGDAAAREGEHHPGGQCRRRTRPQHPMGRQMGFRHHKRGTDDDEDDPKRGHAVTRAAG